MKDANKIAQKICFMDKTVMEIGEVLEIIDCWQTTINECEQLKRKLKRISKIAGEVKDE